MVGPVSEVIPETGAAVYTIERAAEILGLGRTTAYDLIQRGEFPVPTLQIGRRKVVAKVHLERFLLGETSEDVA